MRPQVKKLGRYQQKLRLGLVPFKYDPNSTSFRNGAWKNLSRDEWERNKRAMEFRMTQGAFR